MAKIDEDEKRMCKRGLFGRKEGRAKSGIFCFWQQNAFIYINAYYITSFMDSETYAHKTTSKER